MAIHASKDLWMGLIYTGVGAGTLVLSRGYAFGSPSRMGPGFLPSVVGGLLLAVGVVALVRDHLGRSEPDTIGEGLRVKPIVTTMAAILAFGLLVDTAGFIVAGAALLLISASGSQKFRWDVKAVLGAAALVGASALVFIKGLGIPMVLVGF